MVASYVGNSITSVLSDMHGMLKTETYESFDRDKYHQFLSLRIRHECFYVVDYLLSNDKHVKETREWLKANELDPRTESKCRRYPWFDEIASSRSRYRDVDDAMDDDIYLSNDDGMIKRTVIEVDELAEPAKQALNLLMQSVGGDSPQSIFASIKHIDDELNSVLFEIVCMREEMFSLLEYFPQLEAHGAVIAAYEVYKLMS